MMSREKVKNRISALLAKTTSRGCTEEEAMAAAAKAADLMRQHGLTEGDLFFDEKARATKLKGQSPKARLWPVIALCTNTAEIVVYRADGSCDLSFVGKAPGPEIAHYLMTVCSRAVDHEIRKFKADTFYKSRRTLKTKRQAVLDFTRSLVFRLCRRLPEVFISVISEAEIGAARQALAERYPGATDIVPRKVADVRYNAAAVAGWRAGGDIALSHGVAGQSAPRQIGGAA